MSRSGRKRVSKWDLKEEPQLFLGGTQYDPWPRKAGESVHNKESQPGRHSPQFAGSSDPEWYDVEFNNKDDREFSNVMLALHGDGSYSTKMSPGLDDWRQHNHNCSPRNSRGRSHRSRSRSRSRSLLYGFKQESGLDGRSTAAQTCRDFAAGKCRRGDRGPYLQQEDRDYVDRRCREDSLTNSWESRHRRGGASKYSTSDDSREYLQSMGRSSDLCSDFIKGKCCRGASCKYAHKSVASDKGFATEVFREREYDKNNYASFEHSRKHEPHRTGDIPCKFFAAGYCRNGKFCRFSHYGQTANHDDRSQDDWSKRSSNLDTMEQSGEHLRRSDTSVSHNAKFLEWNEERNGNVGAHEQRYGAFSRDDRLVHRFNAENRSFSHPKNNDKAVDGNEREYVLPKAETTAAGMGGFESKGAENWFDDMEVSSPWNCGQSSGHVVKEESGHISQTSQSETLNETSLHTYEKDITGEMSGQKHQVTAPMAPMISAKACFQSNPSSREDASYAFALDGTKATGDSVMSSIDQKSSASLLSRQSLDQNSHSSGAVTQPLSSFNADGQNQQTFPLYVPRGESITNAQNQPLFQEDKSFSKPNVGDGNKSELTSEIPPTKNILSREQISQFTKLSALAQLIGTVQQHPHLGAAPNPPTSIEYVSSSISNFSVPVNPLAAASVHPNLVVGSETLHDSLSDSIESNKYHIDNLPPALLPNPVEGIVVAGEKPKVLSRDLFTSLAGGPTDGGQCKTSNLEVELDEECHLLDQLNPVAKSSFEGNSGTTAEESKKTLENGALEKMIGDGGADDGKKKNDAKGIWSFKFALVEFVKEILKPKWKEGQISKESHKTIVKKVVDKVTGSIQGTHIPQSQEKIDNYLSSSKAKLTKLVEAYVEKCQKS